MPRIENSRQKLYVALLMGVLCFITNTVLYGDVSPSTVPAGNLFLFLSAGSLGPLGSAVSLVVGALPYGLLTGNDPYVLCSCSSVMTFAYVASRYPRVAASCALVPLWFIILAPIVLSADTEPAAMTAASMAMLAVGEILLSLIASVFLLHPLVWGTLTGASRHVPASAVLIHAVSMVSVLAMFIGMLLAQSHSGVPGQPVDLYFVTLAAVGLMVPFVMAWRLALLIERNGQEYFGLSILNGASRTESFSGLSSDFWRRKREEDRAAPGQMNSAQLKESDVPNGSAALARTSREDGVIMLDSLHTVSFFNRQFLRICSLAEGEHLGKHVSTLGLHPELSRQIIAAAEHAVERPVTLEAKLNQLPNKLRFIELRAQRADSGEYASLRGDSDRIIVTTRDITDRRTIETHLLKAQRLESLGSMVAGMMHSFTNSLTSITGQASLLKNSPDAATKGPALDCILQAADDASQIIRQLGEYAEESAPLIQREDLQKIMSERLDLMKHMAGENFSLQFEPGETAAWIRGDQNLVFQAVWNVVLNGCESYRDGTGDVQISLGSEVLGADASALNPGARPGEYARLRIRDRGIGMSHETLAHAFDPLFSTKTNSGHTGLGLSTTFAIVRALDGFLTVESRVDKGTTVSLYFPLVREAVAQPDETTAAPTLSGNAEERRGQSKILVVEDEEPIRDLVAEMLRQLGYSVSTCAEPGDAIRQHEAHHFDLILLDMVMPKVRGDQLAKQLREIRGSTTTLLMSGSRSPNPALSESDLLLKPFDLEQLRAAVQRKLAQAGEAVDQPVQ